jgi:hypothetical protein
MMRIRALVIIKGDDHAHLGTTSASFVRTWRCGARLGFKSGRVNAVLVAAQAEHTLQSSMQRVVF